MEFENLRGDCSGKMDKEAKKGIALARSIDFKENARFLSLSFVAIEATSK